MFHVAAKRIVAITCTAILPGVAALADSWRARSTARDNLDINAAAVKAHKICVVARYRKAQPVCHVMREGSIKSHRWRRQNSGADQNKYWR
jgi:hypothetical protein